MNVLDYKKLEQANSDSNHKYYNLTVSYTIKRALEANTIKSQPKSSASAIGQLGSKQSNQPILAQLDRSSESTDEH